MGKRRLPKRVHDTVLRKGAEFFLRVVQGPNGLGNPYIHLRIGQLLYELGNLAGAGDNLARAYMGAGEEIFEKKAPNISPTCV